jgi:hypothetical protein
MCVIRWSEQRLIQFFSKAHYNLLAILFPLFGMLSLFLCGVPHDLALGFFIGTILGCIQLKFGAIAYPFDHAIRYIASPLSLSSLTR